MHGISIGPAMALGKNVDFSNHRGMMDIGGGSGVYAIQVVANNPNSMSALVLDSNPVCQVADQYIQQYNLQDKIQTKPFDFFKDQLPNDCDVAFLSHVIHIFDRGKNITLLRKIYDSLPSKNGMIIISEWLLNDEKTGPVPSALMGLTMHKVRGLTFRNAGISSTNHIHLRYRDHVVNKRQDYFYSRMI